MDADAEGTKAQPQEMAPVVKALLALVRAVEQSQVLILRCATASEAAAKALDRTAARLEALTLAGSDEVLGDGGAGVVADPNARDTQDTVQNDGMVPDGLPDATVEGGLNVGPDGEVSADDLVSEEAAREIMRKLEAGLPLDR